MSTTTESPDTATNPEQEEKAEHTEHTEHATVGVEASGHSSFHIIEKILKDDQHLGYGERLLLKAIQSVGLDIVTAIRIYSSETTEDAPAEGNDGFQNEQTGGSGKTE